MNKLIPVLLALAFGHTASADVQLKIKDLSGRVSTVSSDGKHARIDTADLPGYAIIDFANGQILMVDTRQNQVVSTTLRQDGGPADQALAVSLKDKGGGQKLAGYLTRKFELIADGGSCGTVYASKKLLDNSAIREMFSAMRNMTAMTRNMMGGMAGMLPPCQRAQMQLTDLLAGVGAPMKVLDEAGQLQSEVLSVDTDKKVASGYYQTPAGMAVVSLDDKLGQAQEMMKNLPDMNELMQQLQQGGGLPSGEGLPQGGQISEEMTQQMERVKKMLEQLQQQ